MGVGRLEAESFDVTEDIETDGELVVTGLLDGGSGGRGAGRGDALPAVMTAERGAFTLETWGR